MTKRLTAISLFSGCGGMDLGFEKKGFDIVWALDHDYFSCETYRKNFGNKILNKDINEILTVLKNKSLKSRNYFEKILKEKKI